MAKVAGIGDGLLVSGYDVSGDVGSISGIQETWGEQEVTDLSQSAMDRLQLIANGSLAFNNFFNDSDGSGDEARGVHDILTHTTTPGRRFQHLASYHRGREVGSFVANMQAMVFGYSLARSASGNLLGTVNCNSTGGEPIQWGRSLTQFVETVEPEAATGTLTLTVQPDPDDTIDIGNTEYTFVASGAACEGEINVGASLAEAVANIVDAINGDDCVNTANSDVTAAAGEGNTVVITAVGLGAAALSLGTVYTHDCGSGNAFGAATLTGDYGFEGNSYELEAASVRVWLHILEFDDGECGDAVIKIQHSADECSWSDLITLWDSACDAAPPTTVVEDYEDDCNPADDFLRVVVESTEGFAELRFAASVKGL